MIEGEGREGGREGGRGRGVGWGGGGVSKDGRKNGKGV